MTYLLLNYAYKEMVKPHQISNIQKGISQRVTVNVNTGGQGEHHSTGKALAAELRHIRRRDVPNAGKALQANAISNMYSASPDMPFQTLPQTRENIPAVNREATMRQFERESQREALMNGLPYMSREDKMDIQHEEHDSDVYSHHPYDDHPMGIRNGHGATAGPSNIHSNRNEVNMLRNRLAHSRGAEEKRSIRDEIEDLAYKIGEKYDDQHLIRFTRSAYSNSPTKLLDEIESTINENDG
jgi:hypothetical protein